MIKHHSTRPIIVGFALLLSVITAAVMGYSIFFGLGWLEATWLTIVTITGVGYAEQSTKPPSFQLFTILVIILGFVAFAYALTGLVRLLLEGELERAVGKRRMQKEINKLHDHVIVCGYGRLGQFLAADLGHERHEFVVVENDPEPIDQAQQDGYLVQAGDATEEEVLVAAGLERAKSLVTSLPSDAENVFITLTARNLNPRVQIIARAEHPSTARKLTQAGASRTILPALTSARHMVRMITRPTTADLIELVAKTDFQDVELDEVYIPPGNELIGMAMRETHVLFKHRLLVIAVKQRDDTMVFNPDGDYVFSERETAIVMGKREDIDAFCHHFSLRG
ncbi:MAG: potassium channel protein [Planctomycetota bacterium]